MKYIKYFSIYTLPVLCMLLTKGCKAQKPSDKYVQKANYALANQFTVSNIQSKITDTTVRPYWLNDGSSFWYILGSQRGYKFFLVDCKTGEKQELSVNLKRKSNQIYSFTIQGIDYQFNTATGLINSTDSSSTDKWQNWDTVSPDKNKSVYARNYNLFLKFSELKQTEKQITFDGECYNSYARAPDYNYTNVRSDLNHNQPSPADALWSPDSRKLFLYREDVRHLLDLWVINSLSYPRPTLTTYKSRHGGEKRRTIELFIYNLDLDSLIKIQAAKWSEQSYAHFCWNHNSHHLYLVRMSPDHQSCELLAVDPKNGQVTILLEEYSNGLLLTKPPVLLSENKGFLWWSRRSGYGHYYQYDSQGTCLGAVTQGDFTVQNLLEIDEKNKTIFFTACGRETVRNPYYIHLYKKKLNNNNIVLLTPENAHHDIHLSPNQDYLIDNFSTVESPTLSVLRNTNGKMILELEKQDISSLQSTGWQKPEIFKAKADDGTTDLWGVMWKPFDFDPEKKYPLITEVYPGPQDEGIPLTFMQGLINNNVHLSQYGFIVIHSGNRGGSYKRSRKYSDYHHGNLRDFPLADNKKVIEQLAKAHSFIDLDRIGIWGGSSGGFMAATAMFKYPDFYKVGVTRSAQHDPRIYHGWWNNQFQGAKEKKDKGHIRWVTQVCPGNLALVKKLKGKLLILHSEMDTNVHPAHSARLVDALMSSGKRFDYFVVPGGGHGWSRHWEYVQHMIWTYFIHNLMGDERVTVNMFDDF